MARLAAGCSASHQPRRRPHRVAVPISGAPGNVSAEFLAASTDGSKVLFGTTQAMLPKIRTTSPTSTSARAAG